MTAASAATDAGGADAFTYTGTWGGTAPAEKWSTTAGSTATAKVDVGPGGGTISWYGNRDTGGGKATVTVDARTPVTVDTYDPTPPPGLDRNLYTTPWLAEGPHTVKINVLGTARTGATGVAISVKGVNTTNGTIVWPGSTTPTTPTTPPPTSTPLSDPVKKEQILQFVSTVENGDKDWTKHYGYVEYGAGIGDTRGYTLGIVGWTTATYDANILFKAYRAAKPGNVLEKWIDELDRIDAMSTQQQRHDASRTLLGSAFVADVRTAGADPVFQSTQKAERDRMYWKPAYDLAVTDGLSPLGLQVYYDTSVNHGQGSATVGGQSFQGIRATAMSKAKTPAQGGSEAAYLNAVLDARWVVLQQWGDAQTNGRVPALRTFVSTGKFPLTTPYSWNMYGTTHTISAPPTPR
jgi:chitosanase